MPRESAALKGKKSQLSNAKSSRTRIPRPSNPSNKKRASRRRLYLGIAIGVVVLLLAALPLCFNLFVRQDIRIPEVTQKMTNYLEERYDQPFEVTTVHYTGFGFGVTGIWQAEAYPKNDTNLLFSVSSDNGVAKIYDGYQTSIWSAEETEALRPEVGRIYKDSGTTEPKVSAHIVSSGELANVLALERLTFEQAKTRHIDGLFYELRVESSVDGELAIDADTDRVYRLLEYIISGKTESVGLHYTLAYSGKTYTCVIKSSKIATLKSGQDVKNCLSGKGEEK